MLPPSQDAVNEESLSSNHKSGDGPGPDLAAQLLHAELAVKAAAGALWVWLIQAEALGLPLGVFSLPTICYALSSEGLRLAATQWVWLACYAPCLSLPSRLWLWQSGAGLSSF